MSFYTPDAAQSSNQVACACRRNKKKLPKQSRCNEVYTQDAKLLSLWLPRGACRQRLPTSIARRLMKFAIMKTLSSRGVDVVDIVQSLSPQIGAPSGFDTPKPTPTAMPTIKNTIRILAMILFLLFSLASGVFQLRFIFALLAFCFQ